MPRRWTVGEFEVVADDTPMAELCEDTFQQGGLSADACTAGVVAGLRPVGAQALIHRRGAEDAEKTNESTLRPRRLRGEPSGRSEVEPRWCEGNTVFALWSNAQEPFRPNADVHVDRQGRTHAAVLFERDPKTHLRAVATVVFGPNGKLESGPKLTEAGRAESRRRGLPGGSEPPGEERLGGCWKMARSSRSPPAGAPEPFGCRRRPWFRSNWCPSP